MANRVLIPKEDWEILEGFRLPLVVCPGCTGGLLGNSTHEIKANGDVSASVVCSCGFHDFITLDKWKGGVIGRTPKNESDGKH